MFKAFIVPFFFIFSIGAYANNNILNKDWVRLVIEKSMGAAIDNDLIGPPYPAIQSISLQQKIMENMAAVRGEKIGFQMSFENKVDG